MMLAQKITTVIGCIQKVIAEEEWSGIDEAKKWIVNIDLLYLLDEWIQWALRSKYMCACAVVLPTKNT